MRYKILIVDDDANVLATYKRLLRKQFHVDTVQGGAQGVAAVSEQGPYAVVISDLQMPGMDGFQFLSRVRGIAPDSVRMILTGYADLPTAMKAINEGKIYQLLTKPCKPNALTNAITSGIEQFVKNTRVAGEKEKNRPHDHTKKILIVDDDPFIRDILSEAFGLHDEFEILKAENGKIAIESLSSAKIDIVITDLKMPVMSGVALLSYMNKKHLKIPAIILTGHGTPELEAKIDTFSNFSYFEKPLDVNMLIDTVKDALASMPTSQIHGIGVDAFLQLVEMEMKTCTLTIKSQNKIGYLYFLKGDLVASETDGLTGQKAAYDILGWENIVIEIENACIITKREIHQPLMEILMESARIKDDIISSAMN
jgi:DNA-binding NtrC family response regulator